MERVVPVRPLRLVTARPLPAGANAAASIGSGKAAAAAVGAAPAALDVAVDSAREEAAAILAQAREEAAAIIEAARAERQQLLEEARAAGAERGFQEGLERARAQADRIRAEAESTRSEARQVLAEARRVYQQNISAAEGEIIALALSIAAKIIGREIELRPDIVVEIARQAIRQVAEGQHYTIYTDPAAAEVVRQHRAELLAEAAPGARLQVIADPGFTPGGCRVETENGFVDAGVDSQLEALKRILSTGAPPAGDDNGDRNNRKQETRRRDTSEGSAGTTTAASQG